MKWRNLVHCNDGKIAVIDTESFWGAKYGLQSFLELNTFEEDARKLIVDEIANLQLSHRRTLRRC